MTLWVFFLVDLARCWRSNSCLDRSPCTNTRSRNSRFQPRVGPSSICLREEENRNQALPAHRPELLGKCSMIEALWPGRSRRSAPRLGIPQHALFRHIGMGWGQGADGAVWAGPARMLKRSETGPEQSVLRGGNQNSERPVYQKELAQ